MALIDRLKVTSRKFKDISLAFAKHPVTNDIGAFYDEDAIKRSVTNLVRTRIGERFYNPLVGSEVEDSLFENPDLQMATSIEDDIMLLLENFERRIKNTQVIVSFPIDTNELNVVISYDIVGIVLPTQNIEFILQSTRV
tara:strand:+ start:847 stop:1263 length:417 start_codon:yes stop_codon:yes gene_type:complete